MNSVFQVLLHLPFFITDLEVSASNTDFSMGSILREFVTLAGSWRTSKTSVSPERFVDIWYVSVPLMSDGRQHDTAEFFQILAEQCQRELSPLLLSSDGGFSRNLMFASDPFTRTFGISLMSRIKCDKCGDVQEKNQTALVLGIPMTRCVSDGLAGLFSPESIDSTCERCKAKRATISLSITRLPRVLMVQIYRFPRNGGKSCGAVNVNPVIELETFVDSMVCKNSPTQTQTPKSGDMHYPLINEPAPFFGFSVKEDEPLVRRTGRISSTYELKSVISHEGSDVECGHYTATVKDGPHWTVYNDMIVSPGSVDPKTVYCALYVRK